MYTYEKNDPQRFMILNKQKLVTKKANENITQIVKVFPEGPEKWQWVNSKLVELLSSKFNELFKLLQINKPPLIFMFFFCLAGKVLIFVTKITNAAELAKNLQENGVNRKIRSLF